MPFGRQRLCLRGITCANVGVSLTQGDRGAKTARTGWFVFDDEPIIPMDLGNMRARGVRVARRDVQRCLSG